MATNGSAARSPESSDHFEFPGALPSRRLFSDGNGSRPRSLSQSGPTPRYIFTGPAHWPIQPVPQVPSEVAASVFAEVCGEAAWSPLKGDPNPYRSSSGTLAAVAPVGDSSKLNIISEDPNVTPISPKITSPPNIHLSHKKEKASSSRSPFAMTRQSAAAAALENKIDEEEGIMAMDES